MKNKKPKQLSSSPLLWGIHAVKEALGNPERQIQKLHATEEVWKRFEEGGVPRKGVKPHIVERKTLDKMTNGGVHQGLVLAAESLPETFVQDLIVRAVGQEHAVILMLDQVTDPHNVGAILRSACAFGAAGVIMQRRHAPTLTGVLAKTACGAVEHVPVAYEVNLSRALDTLKDGGFTAIGLDERGERSLPEIETPEKCVLVLGAEGPGIRPKVREHCDVLVRLPTGGPIGSLNVSNAAAVGLYGLNSK